MWELPGPEEREARVARLAVVADALARVHTQPGLMAKLREHLQHPALMPPLRGVLKRGHRDDLTTGSVVMGTAVFHQMPPEEMRNLENRQRAAALQAVAQQAEAAAGLENFGHRPG